MKARISLLIIFSALCIFPATAVDRLKGEHKKTEAPQIEQQQREEKSREFRISIRPGSGLVKEEHPVSTKRDTMK